MNEMYIYLIILFLIYFIYINIFTHNNISLPYPSYKLIPTQFYYPKIKNDNVKLITPLTVYMTWGYSSLPQDMHANIMTNIQNNPEFDFYIYDDNKCREFIKDNFDTNVLNAFNNLVPGAYKADLWRYCILYKKGGVYIDIKYSIQTKLINFIKKYPLCFVKDRLTLRIYNGVMIAPPNLKIFDYAINKIVQNVKNKYYGRDPLDPTGPGLLGKIISDNNYNSTIQLLFIGLLLIGDDKIVDQYNKTLFVNYPTYRKEKQKNQKTDTYSNLWLNNKIYL